MSVSGSEPPPSRRASRISARLVLHDIRLERRADEQGSTEVVALIDCERRGCELRVEECARCERFARVETHEAGYTMLCRSEDVEVVPDETRRRSVHPADVDEG